MVLIPDRCSVKESGRDCVNPPNFVISISVDSDEYMVGVTCVRHKNIVRGKLRLLQDQKKLPQGLIQFNELKAIGTDCIRSDPDELIQIDLTMKK